MEPLRDLRVLGVTVFLAGPFLSMTLARLGAEVIKVEAPGRGDPVRSNGPFVGPDGAHATRKSETDLSTRFVKRTQGVKSITLDLKHAQGRHMFLELARASDVVIENLAPGSMKRMGLGYPEVAAVNPGIVYCSISGYGQAGPYAAKPAHDPQIQGMSGLMDINGDADGPPTRVGFYIGDLVTPLFAAYSILAALRSATEVMADPHFWQRGTLQPLRHAAMTEAAPGVGSGFPVVFSGGPLPELAGAPTLGMHNVEIYGGLLGLTAENLVQLREQGVV
jgi:crotonobetainyl-CoA:carnitine CoA-transferase CaiB-like acyl-CoA transferase